MRNVENRPIVFSRMMAVSAWSVAVAGLCGCTWMTPVSVNTGGELANQQSQYLSRISSDGRFVVFASQGDNLVSSDSNGASDVFLRDALDTTTERVSVASDGSEANGASYVTGISGDGRYIVFYSAADNLVPGDTNGSLDVFLHDAHAETTQRVSVGAGGTQANGDSTTAVVSDDGRYVAFESTATNLVAGETNAGTQVYVRDLAAEVTTRASVNNSGSPGNSGSYVCDITPDGRYVGFHSFSSNLVAATIPGSAAGNVFLHDLLTSETVLVSADASGNPSVEGSLGCAISADGQEVAFESIDVFFPGDPRLVQDIYVKDMSSGALEKVSVGADGNPPLRSSYYPAISLDGRYVAFQSRASNLTEAGAAGGVHIYVRDRHRGQTSQLSKDARGAPNTDATSLPDLSGNGRYVSFLTDSNTMFPDDDNGVNDVVVRAVHTLTVDSVVPADLPIGATTSVTISGSNFLPDTVPSIGDATVSNVVVVDENTITLDVTVPVTRAPGPGHVNAFLFASYGPPGQVMQGSAARCLNCVSFY